MTQKQKFNDELSPEDKRKFVEQIGDTGVIISKDSTEYLHFLDELISYKFVEGRLRLQSGDVYSGVLTKWGKIMYCI